ncbi:hypothetical protein N0824_02814 [Microcystis sp. 0824]|nr:hypothetical protein N0824_02814 [Microcystis sp. 0824]
MNAINCRVPVKKAVIVKMAIITSNIEKPDSDDDSFDCIPFPFDFTFQPPPSFS